MESEQTGSTVPRRQLGRFLKALRENAKPKKITIEQAAAYLDCSTQKIWRIEKGAGPVRAPDVRLLCDFYGADAKYTEDLMSLAKETKTKGWWFTYGVELPDWFDLYLGLESASNKIRKFEPILIPGLLQSLAYMEDLFRTFGPDRTEEELERRIKLRQVRQSLLTRQFPEAPATDFVISQAALLIETATSGAMHQQLVHLLKANEQPNITIRILPNSKGLHQASVGGGFTILDFPDESEPTTVYSEGITGALYLDRPSEIEVFNRAWSELDDLALSAQESNEMITSILHSQVEG
ncbi:helix-turn-helix domain-containing protein [Actinoplanes sp. HUAS TT8]|uniref:helix-turn-helix domain-containing protein n=1 Tax=Actinoplanes sp. HUAS TT8 TaxID=3447453 RepID=UPI003F51AE4B